jgi:thiamine kinase-like enzyme
MITKEKEIMTVIASTTAVNPSFPLLPIIQRSFPNARSYSVDNNIVQANAEGFSVRIDDDTTTNVDLFVKCVEASKYSHKPWADLRRTLLYSRTEARFYSDILPLLKESSSSDWEIAPTCHLAESYLNDLIGEEESAAAKPSGDNDDPNYDKDNTSILQGKGGNLILESLKEGYYQTSPLSPSQASQCLSAVAKFHAAAFANKEILQQVSQKLCEYGGSYHLKNRNPSELIKIRDTWKDFVTNMRDGAPKEFFEREHIQNMGQRIYDIAEYVSMELSPTYDDDFATIVHGDYKSMNVFLPLTDDKQPLLIDFASSGVGIGVSDVAMHIPHAVHPKDLIDGGEEKLVLHYIDEFHNALPPVKRELYSKEQAMRHYRFATVDYFRFIMGRLWRGSTLESFEKKKNSKNAVLVSRNIEAALAFIERVDKCVEEIEKEIEANTSSN